MSKKRVWDFLFMTILVFSMLIFGLKEHYYGQREIKEQNQEIKELYGLIDWLAANTEDTDVFLAKWPLAPYIYGFANRKVIATAKVYPSEIEVVSERYKDLDTFFYSINEDDSLNIVKKYNITYIVVGGEPNDQCRYNDLCNLKNQKEFLIYRLDNNENLRYYELVHSSDFYKVFKVRNVTFSRNIEQYDPRIAIGKYLSSGGNLKNKNSNVVGSIVPHHIIYADNIIAENMDTINKKYEKIIIIGPDHESIGSYKISTSYLNMKGYESKVQVDIATIRKLRIRIDNGLHKYEWSIKSIMPFINYWQKDAKIVPILFGYNIDYENAVIFGRELAKVVDNNTLVIASIDFSHIMPANEEINRIEDNKTLKNLLDFNKKDIYNRVTEGKPALVAFMTVMEMKNATNVKLLNISSKSHPKGNSTQSVGYISLQYSK